MAALATSALMAAAGSAQAQPAWPSKPVRMIVNFGAGGSADTMARLVAPRMQEAFGQPIGSFQAIKHKCADMLLEVESGKSAAYYAAWAAAVAAYERVRPLPPAERRLIRWLDATGTILGLDN
jgi:alkylation response protein AidB-like acyl-CoA dehydrogenase